MVKVIFRAASYDTLKIFICFTLLWLVFLLMIKNARSNFKIVVQIVTNWSYKIINMVPISFWYVICLECLFQEYSEKLYFYAALWVENSSTKLNKRDTVRNKTMVGWTKNHWSRKRVDRLVDTGLIYAQKAFKFSKNG